MLIRLLRLALERRLIGLEKQSCLQQKSINTISSMLIDAPVAALFL